jgi:hypothetical protein
LHFDNAGQWDLASADLSDIGRSWHHVAVTKRGKVFTLFNDGQAVGSATNNLSLLSTNDLRIGSFLYNTFENGTFGCLDEVSIYNRALSSLEIGLIYRLGTNGKYLPPVITGPPTNTIGILGTNALIALKSIGTPPLQYQWLKNGIPISDGTNATLAFTNIHSLDTNAYSLTVYNQYGASTSQEAQLVVKVANLTLGLTPKLTIEGVAGKTYAIQYATNLDEPVTWTTLTNITLTQLSQIWYDYDTDASLPDKPQRYYQVIAGP